LCCALEAHGDDLHFKKTISVGGNPVTSSEVWVKGARERSVTTSPAGNTITLRQCDLKRMVAVNEQNQAYVVANRNHGFRSSASSFAGVIGFHKPC
jgi:hypothetical protein